MLHSRIPLTLIAVLQILVNVNHDGDWAKAIAAAVPQRQISRPAQSRRERRAGVYSALTRNWSQKSDGKSKAPNGVDGADDSSSDIAEDSDIPEDDSGSGDDRNNEEKGEPEHDDDDDTDEMVPQP